MPTAKDLLEVKARREVYTTAPEATVQNACRLMSRERIGCLVVMQGEKIVGIFTERDVLNRVVAEGRDPTVTRVGDVMSKDVIVVSPDRAREDIESIMKQQRIRHIPVAGPDRMLGLLSIGDMLAWDAANDKQILQYFHDYIYGRH
jgi:CBS domain-containing protein